MDAVRLHLSTLFCPIVAASSVFWFCFFLLNGRPFNIDRSTASSSFGELDPIAVNSVVQKLVQQQCEGRPAFVTRCTRHELSLSSNVFM
jgi:hypothetical protein